MPGGGGGGGGGGVVLDRYLGIGELPRSLKPWPCLGQKNPKN